jgi:hypothetical protein
LAGLWRPFTRFAQTVEEEFYAYRRPGYGYIQRGYLYDYTDIGAAAAYVFDCGPDYQYFSDGNIDPGADADVCAKDSGCICGYAVGWSLDVKQYVWFYGAVVV